VVLAAMFLRNRALPAGFIPPCLPTKARQTPSGDLWLHEIKHDGFRVIARKDGERVKLYSRTGNDLIARFPRIVEALARLRSRSCIIDGEAVACQIVFDHACKLGFEGIVSKRKDSIYRSGPSPDWLKTKNPASPAVRREAEEDWR
jgi:ATP-dependent DNA ligase